MQISLAWETAELSITDNPPQWALLAYMHTICCSLVYMTFIVKLYDLHSEVHAVMEHNNYATIAGPLHRVKEYGVISAPYS